MGATKKCNGCGQEKSLDEFHRNRSKSDGRQSRCAECCNVYSKEYCAKWRNDNPTYSSEYSRANRERLTAMERERRTADPEYAERRRESKRRSDQKDSHKVRARKALRYAVKTGKIKRPSECSGCGDNSGRIQAHHEDYDKPYDVVWVCQPCHAKIHYPERRRGL